jgi:hypothetical protein
LSSLGEQQEGEPTTPAVLGSNWEWADSIDATALRRMAQVTLALFKQPERWIHRRVERIYFKSPQLAHHQVSADFTLPTGVPPVSKFDGKDVYIAPLFLLVKGSPVPLFEGKPGRRRFILFGKRKVDPSRRPVPTAPYSNLNFTDQDGNRLPLLTRRQSSLLAATMLLEVAERALGEAATGKLRHDILAIPSRSRLDLGPVLEWLLKESTCLCDPRTKLREDDVFPELAYMLASHSIVACLLMDGPPQRSIYKLSYDEPPNEGFSRRKGRLRRSLGLRTEQYFVPLNEIGGSASYHVEIEVPKDLLTTAISLVGKRYRWFGGHLRDKDNLDYSIQQVVSASEGKIYVPQPLPGRRVGFTWVKLRVDPSGFFVGAIAASWITTIMLALGALAVLVVVYEHESEAAAAALLLVPAVLALYVARPGEHAITSKMLRGARFALVFNAIIPAVAVLFLITASPSSPHLIATNLTGGTFRLSTPPLVWTGLAILSMLFSLLFVLCYFAPRPRGKTVYQPMPRSPEDESMGSA